MSEQPKVDVSMTGKLEVSVYFRRSSGKLGKMTVGTTDHVEAILMVKEVLVESGDGWGAPVLAVVASSKPIISDSTEVLSV